MKLTSPLVKITNLQTKTKFNEDGTSYTYGIIEIGDDVTGITEDLFINSNSLDLMKDLKKGDKIALTLKNHNGKFNIDNIVKENK